MRRILAVTGAVLLVGLAGCVGPEPAETLTRSRGAAPGFASDEEALAVAEAAYAAYLAVSDAILQDGGADPERIASHVTGDELPRTLESFTEISSRGLHTEGATAFDSMTLIQHDEFDISVYLCLDVTDVGIFDAGGEGVTPVQRDDRLPLEVDFHRSGDTLRISRSETWSGSDFC